MRRQTRIIVAKFDGFSEMRMKRVAILTFFCCLMAGFIVGCNSDKSEDVAKVNPDLTDPELLAAEKEARETVQQLVDVIKADKPRISASVKMKFVDGEQAEYLWLTRLRISGDEIFGALNEEPKFVGNVEFGKEYSVKVSDIHDWMIVENGSVSGGYTEKVFAKRKANK